ncbi:putative bifunctional diguanylate cyclase/phosphodiesterase [Deefgea rivuli]|uniref:putative bifunctional diguanylate cyclase/phosphodiesterase n=1 Tax=Deefgea rivuli TaxID=400948 RepID=UPI000687A6B9|nr:bifunctional diguanylate cyclase/phosphodiesterase [Deefgea rivuli]
MPKSNELGSSSQLINELAASLITLDLQGYITGWNKGAAQLFGYSADDVIGQHILMLYAEESADDSADFNTVLVQGHAQMEVLRRKKNGDTFWANIHLTLVRNSENQAVRMIGYVTDITEQLAFEEKNRLYNHIFEQATDAIVITNLDFHCVGCNAAYQQMTEKNIEQTLGQLPSFLQALQHEPGIPLYEQLNLLGHWKGELWDQRASGQRYPIHLTISGVKNKRGELTHYFAVFSDLSEQKQAEAQIHRLAYFDQLTNLPNRIMLFALLEQALTEARRNNQHGALLCFNIARFKALNDSFGHRAADQVLIEVALRIRASLRDEDVVSRFGADEFYIGLFDISHRDDASLVAQRILHAISLPLMLGHEELLLNASIGISVYPDDGRDAEKLINQAAVALHRGKQAQQEMLFYSPEMNQRSMARLKLTSELHHALERHELQLFYQGQYDAQSAELVGAEALIRWQHPSRGFISPAEFIPFAEETGLIIPIGEWVIFEATRQLAQWDANHQFLPRLAINLSARQFKANLPEQLIHRLDSLQLQPNRIELELTESILMQSDEITLNLLRELKTAGFSLALDDFGTGYSNLSYLQRFTLDYLKIDQSFIRGLPDDKSSAGIVNAICGIARSLNLRLIAEGVETATQLAFLQQIECDQIQGYLLGHPLPATEFAQLLSARPSP